jgi:hypothetical protein
VRLASFGVLPAAEETDVERARRDMAVFDRLEPEARAAFRDACQQFGVRDVVELIETRGAPWAVKEALSRRGLLPYQVGTDGVVAETVRQLDARHTNDANKAKGV